MNDIADRETIQISNPVNQNNRSVRKKKFPHVSLKALSIIFSGLLVIGLFLGGFWYYKNSMNKPQGPSGQGTTEVLSQDEVKDLVSEVGELIRLPSSEEPTIATVSNLDQLQGQDFFQYAKEGDKVLVYRNAKRAYLYRSDEKRLIEVGTISFGEGDVAGDSDEIPVILPSPIPTQPITSPEPVTPAPSANTTTTPTPTAITPTPSESNTPTPTE
ncbi:hypothetical protein JXA63_05625 [Candidatus Woesebacteria bacterium]|nr:hypothetical protein [Candidatus Woesebacteria bacterium]